MKNVISFQDFSNNKLLEKKEKKEKTIAEIEKEEREKWKKIEKDMLSAEKKMKADAEKDINHFYNSDKKASLANKANTKDALIDTSDIEERERKKWRELETDMIEDERRMKRDAEKGMKTFFSKVKSTPSTYSSGSSSSSSSRSSSSSVPSGLHYSSQYKSHKPKTTGELKRLIETGAVEQVASGTYHFSVKENGVKKYFFRFTGR